MRVFQEVYSEKPFNAIISDSKSNDVAIVSKKETAKEFVNAVLTALEREKDIQVLNSQTLEINMYGTLTFGSFEVLYKDFRDEEVKEKYFIEATDIY